LTPLPVESSLVPATVTKTPARDKPAPEPATGWLTIIAKPWAEVFVDRRRVGISPFGPLELPAGSHRVLLRQNPRLSFEREVSVAPGARDTLAFDLKAAASRLTIAAVPWGYLWIDGDSIGLLPHSGPLWISPGLHTLEIRHPDMGEWRDTLTVNPSEEITLKLDLKNGTVIALDRSGESGRHGAFTGDDISPSGSSD